MAGFAWLVNADVTAWGRPVQVIAAVTCALLCVGGYAEKGIDLGNAMVVVRPGERPSAERMAAVVLIEEVERRTAIRLSTSTTWPAGKTVIAISARADQPTWGRVIPIRRGEGLPERLPEGYRVCVETRPGGSPVIWIVGADPRGALYGVGALLRHLEWTPGQVRLSQPLDIATAPVDPIRGHQLGYRARARTRGTGGTFLSLTSTFANSRFSAQTASRTSRSKTPEKAPS